MCLVIKTYILLNEKLTAKLKLESYIRDNRILEDVSFLPSKTQYNAETKEYFEKKLNLMSTLANLSYNLGLPCINLYILYT